MTMIRNGSLTWQSLIVVLIPIVIGSSGLIAYVLDGKIQEHANIPYHSGIRDVAYDKARGEVLEARLSRMEEDIQEIKQIVKEIQQHQQR